MKERNYGIDLLRLVLMYMVCLLHTLGRGGILMASQVGTLDCKILWFIEVAAFCAVDGFALISGYTAVDKPQRYSKIVNMWFQAFFYSFIVTLIFTVMGLNTEMSVGDIVKSAFPITFNSFWYFTSYFALFFAMPLLNKFICYVSEETAKKTLISIFVIYSVIGIWSDPLNSQWGYSAVWVIIVYCVGGLVKQAKLFEKKSTLSLILLWLICIVIAWAFNIYDDFPLLINYNALPILFCGIIMLVLFSRLKPNPKIICKLSPLAFGVYLLQTNRVIWTKLTDAYTSVATWNIVATVAAALGIALGVFIVGIIVEIIRVKLFKLLRIHKFSECVTEVADKILTKVIVVFR